MFILVERHERIFLIIYPPSYLISLFSHLSLFVLNTHSLDGIRLFLDIIAYINVVSGKLVELCNDFFEAAQILH
jgi:hypothetical protein